MRRNESRLADPLAGRAHFCGVEQLEPRLLLSSGTLHGFEGYPNVQIPDNSGTVNMALTVSGAPANATITDVDVRYKIVHPYVGDLQVWLTSYYEGSWHDHLWLWNREGGSQDNIDETEYGLDTWDGASPNQTWYLVARDQASRDTGYIDSLEIWVDYYYSDPKPDNDAYINVTTEPREWGQSITADLRVANEGSGRADNVDIRLVASNDSTIGDGDDYTINTWYNADINAGSTWTNNGYSWTLPSSPYPGMPTNGTVYYGLWVETASGETDTSDNTDYDSVSMSMPQITDADISIASIDTVVAGDAVTVNYTVTNTSNYSRSFGVGGEMWQSSTKKADLGTQTTSTLSPGGTYSGSFSYTTGTAWSGTYTARCAVWTGTPGSSTHLDTYDRGFSVAAQSTDADITVSSISTVVAGETVTVNYTVTNTSNYSRSFGVGGEMWQSSTKKADLGTQTTSTLSPGGTYSGSFSYTTGTAWSGTYTARCAVWTGTPGSSTHLDTYDRNFSVAARLTDAGIAISSINTVVAGDVVTMNYTVTNTGNFARPFGVGGEIWQGTTKKVDLGTTSTATLVANGGTWSGTFTYSTPGSWGGSYFARCAVWDGVPGVGTQLDTEDRGFSVTPQSVPDITSGRMAWHSYTAYDDDGTGYRPLDGAIHVYDFGTASSYTRAEATIAAEVVHAMNPNFSADGRYLTFMGLSASRTYSHTDDSWANWLDAYTYDFRTDTITNVSAAAGRAAHGQVDEDPVFSPDGGEIVFKKDRSDLWVINTSDYTLRQLTAGPGEESGPQFSPDGSWVVFWVGDGANAHIAKVATSSSAATSYISVIDNDPVSFSGDTGVQDYFPSYWDESRIIYTSWDTSKLPGENDDDDIRIRDVVSGGADYFAGFNSGYPVDDSDAFVISSSLLGFSTRTGWWDLWYGNPVSGASRSLGIGVSSKHNLGGEYTQLVVPYVANQAPTDIALLDSNVPENQPVGTEVGNLSTTDPDAGDTFVYNLVSGTGSTDNASFTLSGSQLRTAASFNYEAQSSYSIRVRTTDQGGTGLSYEKVFTISITDEIDAQVLARHIFYNNSYFDGNNASANTSDDTAIDTSKQALMPGDTATFANYTSYSRGINGIMIDIEGLAGTPHLSDFVFKTGNSNDPSTWATAPAPTGITVRPGEGDGDSDRVTIIWADNVIQKQWLQVTVLSDANGGSLGLAEDDVFYFGNSIGETGNSGTNAFVDGTDFVGVRDNPHNFLNRAPVDDAYDINRDSFVDGTDLVLVRDNNTNFLTALKLIAAPDLPAGASQQIMALSLTAEPMVLSAEAEEPAPMLATAPVEAEFAIVAPTAAGNEPKTESDDGVAAGDGSSDALLADKLMPEMMAEATLEHPRAATPAMPVTQRPWHGLFETVLVLDGVPVEAQKPAISKRELLGPQRQGAASLLAVPAQETAQRGLGLHARSLRSADTPSEGFGNRWWTTRSSLDLLQDVEEEDPLVDVLRMIPTDYAK